MSHVNSKGRDLTAAEHSRLVYLLDALEAAPGKRVELLSIADKEDASDAYARALDSLRTPPSAELQAACAALRGALRGTQLQCTCSRPSGRHAFNCHFQLGRART